MYEGARQSHVWGSSQHLRQSPSQQESGAKGLDCSHIGGANSQDVSPVNQLKFSERRLAQNLTNSFASRKLDYYGSNQSTAINFFPAWPSAPTVTPFESEPMQASHRFISNQRSSTDRFTSQPASSLPATPPKHHMIASFGQIQPFDAQSRFPAQPNPNKSVNIFEGHSLVESRLVQVEPQQNINFHTNHPLSHSEHPLQQAQQLQQVQPQIIQPAPVQYPQQKLDHYNTIFTAQPSNNRTLPIIPPSTTSQSNIPPVFRPVDQRKQPDNPVVPQTVNQSVPIPMPQPRPCQPAPQPPISNTFHPLSMIDNYARSVGQPASYRLCRQEPPSLDRLHPLHKMMKESMLQFQYEFTRSACVSAMNLYLPRVVQRPHHCHFPELTPTQAPILFNDDLPVQQWEDGKLYFVIPEDDYITVNVWIEMYNPLTESARPAIVVPMTLHDRAVINKFWTRNPPHMLRQSLMNLLQCIMPF